MLALDSLFVIGKGQKGDFTRSVYLDSLGSWAMPSQICSAKHSALCEHQLQKHLT